MEIPNSLTSVERLQLVNQYKILGKLEPENEDEYLTLRKILEGGITFCYDKVLEDISEELASEKSYFVVNVVNMFLVLQYSFEKLEESSCLKEVDVLFWGFDKEEEKEEWRFVECGRRAWPHWRLVKIRTEGSRGPFTERYSKMLARWDVISKNYTEGYNLTEKDIKAVLGNDNKITSGMSIAPD